MARSHPGCVCQPSIMAWRQRLLIGAVGALLVVSTQGDVMKAWEELEADGGKGLEQTLRECRIGQLTDHDRCQEAEYISAVHDNYEKLRVASSSAHDGEVVVKDLPVLSRNKTSFSDFFLEYAAKTKPVVLQGTPGQSKTPLQGVTPSLVDSCLNGTQGPATIALPATCPEVASLLTLPHLVANDYTQRLRHHATDSMLQSYINHYPQLVLGQPRQTQPLHACPSSRHMVIAVDSGHLLVKVFEASKAELLGPELGRAPALHEFRFTADVWGAPQPVNVAVVDEVVAPPSPPVVEEKDDEIVEGDEEEDQEEDGGLESEEEEGMNEEEKELKAEKKRMAKEEKARLAQERRRKLVEEENKKKEAAATATTATKSTTASIPVSHFTASLHPGDLLFVPRGSLVSWRYEDAGVSKAMVVCYVDASNLNAVKTSLALESHIDQGAHLAWEGFMAPDFDTWMERMPQDLSWSAFTTWPRGGKKEGMGEEMVGNGTSASTSGGGGRKKRSESRSERKSGFNTWQHQKKWDQTIMELTLPTPSIPHVVSIGRTNVTVEWKTAFSKRKEDVASMGYEIGWVAQGATGPAQEGKAVVLDEEVVKETAVNDPRVAEGVSVWLCRTTIQNLQPQRVYQFRAQMFFGEARGLWSSYSPSITTKPLSTPTMPANISIRANRTSSTSVTLVLEPPVDDGGVPIESYVVWKQHVDHQDEWMLAGNFSSREAPTLSIRNLLPDTQYAFRVAAVNRLGIGPKTTATPRISTLASTSGESVHVGGHGHGTQNLQSEYGNIGPVFTIDTQKQQLSLADPKAKPLEIWASQWGPRNIRVTAEAVWADPLDASTNRLANGDMIRHRIAITNRGGVPLVQKASAVQSAGGLAVIVVDDGRCETGFDQFCCPGADKNHGEGLAASDWSEPWLKIRIPVILVLSHHSPDLDNATQPFQEKIKNLIQVDQGRDEL